MKNQVLSIGQMKHLKELGVDVSKGSMCWAKSINTEYPEIGTSFSLEASENASLGESPHEGSFWECIELTPAFTLQDILELLPNFISKDGYIYDLTSDMHNSMAYKIDWDNLEDNDLIDVDDLYLHTESDGSNLLKMAFKMLCWLAEKGHLTKKEEEEKDNCHVCGKTNIELVECECCGELYCDDCSSIYNQFTQIDYNCCKPCSERERE